MIYTTNWIERLQKDFRRVTRMRGAMPNEESVLLLMGKTAMDKKSYLRQVPRIDLDETLFPPEKAAPQRFRSARRGKSVYVDASAAMAIVFPGVCSELYRWNLPVILLKACRQALCRMRICTSSDAYCTSRIRFPLSISANCFVPASIVYNV